MEPLAWFDIILRILWQFAPVWAALVMFWVCTGPLRRRLWLDRDA